jgi:hypothetical protein
MYLRPSIIVDHLSIARQAEQARIADEPRSASFVPPPKVRRRRA